MVCVLTNLIPLFLKYLEAFVYIKKLLLNRQKKIYFNILEISKILLKKNKALHILRNGTTEYLISCKTY